MNSVKTEKGTVLPLITLKGKDYLMVAHRLIWFNEEVKRYNINTQFIHLDDNQTVCKATVNVFNENGDLIKSASATKRETKSDFSDHTEKAETSAIGRAVALLGFGTQFAIADLEEGDRLADSPVVNTKAETTKEKNKKVSSFRKPSTKTDSSPSTSSTSAVGGWE